MVKIITYTPKYAYLPQLLGCYIYVAVMFMFLASLHNSGTGSPNGL